MTYGRQVPSPSQTNQALPSGINGMIMFYDANGKLLPSTAPGDLQSPYWDDTAKKMKVWSGTLLPTGTTGKMLFYDENGNPTVTNSPTDGQVPGYVAASKTVAFSSILYDAAGKKSVDFANRQLDDTDESITVDYHRKFLINGGATNLDWSSATQFFANSDKALHAGVVDVTGYITFIFPDGSSVNLLYHA
jgi:hypothetical protein